MPHLNMYIDPFTKQSLHSDIVKFQSSWQCRCFSTLNETILKGSKMKLHNVFHRFLHTPTARKTFPFILQQNVEWTQPLPKCITNCKKLILVTSSHPPWWCFKQTAKSMISQLRMKEDKSRSYQFPFIFAMEEEGVLPGNTILWLAGVRGHASHTTPWLAGMCEGRSRQRRAAVRRGRSATAELLCPWNVELLCGWSKLHKIKKVNHCENIRFSLSCLNFFLPGMLAPAVEASVVLSWTLSSSSTNTGSRLVLEHAYSAPSCKTTAFSKANLNLNRYTKKKKKPKS